MPRAKLRVSIPAEAWIGAITREFPEVEFRVLAALPTAETGIGLVELRGPNVSSVVEAFGNDETVVSLEVLGESDERTLIQFETTEPLLLFSVRESGLPLEPPVEIRDGRATIEVTASRDSLSTFGKQLEQFGMRYEVEFIRRGVEATERLLTDRQRELLVAAVERGYYDTPRDCSLTELADHLDMAKSTVSETLHRAEEAVVKEFVADLDESQLLEGEATA